MAEGIPVVLEIAPRRTFAVALEWPGWARSGRTEADALASLAAYATRYRAVVGRGFKAPGDAAGLHVVERLKGGATTEFGAPGAIPKADQRALDAAELNRQVRILRAAWKALDSAADAAHGRTLRTGPRGGGRNVPKMLEHVFGAEVGYLRSLGVCHTGPPGDMAALRKAVVAGLRAVARNEPIPNPTAVRKPWPPRYFVRRAAWHVLDHAWEIEDRSAESS